VPEDLRSLRSQRCRWRRGLLQVLWRRRQLMANPRAGIIGFGVLPYIAVFEGIGPLLEVSGYAITGAAAAAGLIDWSHFRVMMVASLLFGAAVTLLAVVLSDVATRRYLRGRELMLLMTVAVLENCGYRQLNAWWGCVGTLQACIGSGGWGPMTRRGFAGS
jgi:hypothetical protein